MADRKLSALAALTAPTADDELYIINSGVPQKIRLDDLSIDGTFTPTLYGSTIAGTQTYATQQGSYSRIGNMVLFSIHIVLSAYDVATAGNLRIGGLPFTPDYSFALSIGYMEGITKVADTIINAVAAYASTDIYLYSTLTGTTTATSSYITNTSLTNTFNILLSGTYRTS